MKRGEMAMSMRDGDVVIPAAYRDWAQFVPTVDKPDAAQVREVYINQVALTAKRGMTFMSDTASVMDIYAAGTDTAGDLRAQVDRRLFKGALQKVFVMAKSEGGAARLPAGTVSNGDWVFGAHLADDETLATDDFSRCRGCHAPLAANDYVARDDAHFDHRM